MIPDRLPTPQLLQDLQQEIPLKVPDSWLFPARRGVCGFMGTGPVVIVGWRPAMGPFPDDGANKRFYDILTDYGLENSHLTNVVKSRGRKGQSDPDDLMLHEAIFVRELEIVSGSRAVVPLGDAYDRVAAILLKLGTKPIYRLRQYASMNYGPENVAIFEREISELSKIAQRQGWI